MGRFRAYGKMPALGDFFRLEAERVFVACWDLWLQDTLLAARQDLGARFEACYMSAPIWRFALPPGVAGPEGVVGVLMPSVDRVGRQFPLTLLAHTGHGEQAPLRNLIWQSPVLDAVEALALDSLDDSLTRELLEERLAPMALRPMGPASRIATSGSSLVLTNEVPELFCADLALDLAGGELHRSCAWSASINGAARMMLTAGLPRGEVATSLFDIAGHRG
jgi:type VI secretion system protein ImpM